MRTILTYLREVKSEIQKVVWPSRKDTIRYTVMVLVFCLIMAAILGAADYGLLKGFQAIFK